MEIPKSVGSVTAAVDFFNDLGDNYDDHVDDLVDHGPLRMLVTNRVWVDRPQDVSWAPTRLLMTHDGDSEEWHAIADLTLGQTMQTGHGYVITTNELHPFAPYGDNENAKYPGTGAYVISPDDRDPWLLLATYNLVRGWEAFHRANNFEKAENGSMDKRVAAARLGGFETAIPLYAEGFVRATNDLLDDYHGLVGKGPGVQRGTKQDPHTTNPTGRVVAGRK